MQSETKVCQNCKKDFTVEPDDCAGEAGDCVLRKLLQCRSGVVF